LTNKTGRPKGRRVFKGVMVAKALEESDPEQERYGKLLEALSSKDHLITIGSKAPIFEAKDRALGIARYGADLPAENPVYAKIVRSKFPHAKIKKIDTSRAEKLPGVIGVFTAEDIPGINEIGALVPDQPLLATDTVRYYGDSVAIVAAEDPLTAEEAAELVDVEYEPLPAVFSPLDAMKPNAPKIHEGGNYIPTGHFLVKKGDVQKAFAQPDIIVVEHEYRTQHQEHAFLDPEANLAIPEKDGTMTIIAGLQFPFGVQMTVAKILGLRSDQVRVIQAATGGSFGGRDATGPQAKAALVAYKTKRPTILTYTREESMTEPLVRHPYIMRYKTGATKDGKLIAVKAEIFVDAGAYETYSSGPAWRAATHAAGPYQVPNVHIEIFPYYTNNTPSGAFRGFGNPQVHFATESQMDELSEKLDMDPVEFRLKNILRDGSATATGQILDHSVGLEECVKKAVKDSHWKEKRAKYKEMKGAKKKGIGISLMYHGASTLSEPGEGPDYARSTIIVNKDGSVTYRTGIIEMGQGSPTAHTLIVAEALGIPLNYINLERFDSRTHPDAGITVASRGTYMGGISALIAAKTIAKRMKKKAAQMLDCRPSKVDFKEGKVSAKNQPSKKTTFKELAVRCHEDGIVLSETTTYIVPRIYWDNEMGQGDTYHAFTFSATVSEVEVDMETGQVQVLKVTPVYDLGRVINRLGAEGQVEGGVVQAVGYAIMEELVHKEGLVTNPNLADYYIPTSMDSPEITSNFVEHPFKRGPYGAKGFAESPIVGTAPSIANAIYHATGTRVRSLPITSEKIHLSLEKGE